jgi:hypothetical protein
MNKTLKRELEVAFSKRSQSPFFRIIKYIVIGFLVYLFWGTKTLWWIFGPLLVLAFSIHFWYRFKTHAWTKSYGGWKYEKNKMSPEEENNPL